MKGRMSATAWDPLELLAFQNLILKEMVKQTGHHQWEWVAPEAPSFDVTAFKQSPKHNN